MNTPTPVILNWLRQHAHGASLCSDSRQLKVGEVFVALKGATHDGRDYLEAMAEKGAIAVLCEGDGLQLPASFLAPSALPYLSVHGLKNALEKLIPAYYEHPDRSMSVFAITGTNGKTTISQWLGQALAQLTGSVLVIGTLGVWKYSGRTEGKPYYDTGYTTPDNLSLFRAIAQAKKDETRQLIIEASSIGIVEKRLAGLHIDVAIFTNLTQDHLDYHGSMLAYEAAKRQLFDTPSLRAAVLNLDDPMAWRLLSHLKNRPLSIVGYTLNADILREFIQKYPPSQSPATVTQYHSLLAKIKQQEGSVTRIKLQGNILQNTGPQVIDQSLTLPILGTFNVSSTLAVIASLMLQDIPWSKIHEAVKGIQSVPGRMQVAGQAPLVIIDFAHTPDAIEKILTTLRPIAKARKSKLWCVLGCGGNRDPKKRPLMGQRAQLADEIILTSDNPRDEDPARIIADIQAGIDNHSFTVIMDRALAISTAIANAEEIDVIVIAGKGHETTQEIRGVKKPFEDILHVQLALKNRVFNQQFFGPDKDPYQRVGV